MSWGISRRLELRRLIIIYLLVGLFLAFTLPPLVIPFFTSFKTMSDVYALPPKILPTPFTIHSYVSASIIFLSRFNAR